MSAVADSAGHAGLEPADRALNLPCSGWIGEQLLDDSLVSLQCRADGSRVASSKDDSQQATFQDGLLMWRDDLLGRWRLVVPVALWHERIRALYAEKWLRLGMQKNLTHDAEGLLLVRHDSRCCQVYSSLPRMRSAETTASETHSTLEID
ncbi:unnamed protein product [Lampetra fluviatilis]